MTDRELKIEILSAYDTAEYLNAEGISIPLVVMTKDQIDNAIETLKFEILRHQKTNNMLIKSMTPSGDFLSAILTNGSQTKHLREEEFDKGKQQFLSRN